MPSQLDKRLAALAAADAASVPESALAGLEDGVWTRVQQRRAAAAAGSTHVRVALTVLALGAGMAFGVFHQTSRAPRAQAVVAELGVLSEDGFLAPSVRLGGGA